MVWVLWDGTTAITSVDVGGNPCALIANFPTVSGYKASVYAGKALQGTSTNTVTVKTAAAAQIAAGYLPFSNGNVSTTNTNTATGTSATAVINAIGDLLKGEFAFGCVTLPDAVTTTFVDRLTWVTAGSVVLTGTARLDIYYHKAAAFEAYSLSTGAERDLTFSASSSYRILTFDLAGQPPEGLSFVAAHPAATHPITRTVSPPRVFGNSTAPRTGQLWPR